MKKTIIIILLSQIIVFGQTFTKPTSKDYKIDFAVGIGAFPLDANIGIGYFVTRNIVGIAKLAFLAMPFGSSDYSTTIGIKYIQRQGNSFVSSLEIGALFDNSEDSQLSKISFNKYHGITLKGGVGYMLINQFDSHLGANLNFHSFLFNDQTDKIIFELEIVLGLSI